LLFAAGLAWAATADAATWTPSDIQSLTDIVNASRAEGLDPADYDLDQLRQPGVNDADLNARADRVALKLAHDYFEGAAPPSADWHIARGTIDYRSWLEETVARHSLRGSFRMLLPTAPDYLALKGTLAHCAGTECATIRANLDRWRRLPRDLGPTYLWVNVPAFRLDLIQNGKAIASHRIIVGKPGSKTPIFQAAVTGVTVNPWWNVPCSIVDESVGAMIRANPAKAARLGYVTSTDKAGKLVVRQRPGPDNALGRIKLEMPNPYGVYIHDTPSKSLFARDTRAFSHGCIRTEDPQSLAAILLGPDRSNEVDILLATGVSKTLAIKPAIPVYVVYLTAERDPAGDGSIAYHDDVYRRDRP
jgi:hypothetical protein